MSLNALEKLKGLLGYATPDERAELAEIARRLTPAWVPMFHGPQKSAYESEADVLFYGGAAGGGKTDLVIGAALTRHCRSMIFRRVGTELQAIIDRMAEILGTDEGFNAQKNLWKLPERQVEFGAVPVLGDEKKYQGRPHDFKCVGKGTLILMADGSHKPVEVIKRGDIVETLEGARRVTKVFPPRIGNAVIATSYHGSQVQGSDHFLLTSAGWVCRDSANLHDLLSAHSTTSPHSVCISCLSRRNQLQDEQRNALVKRYGHEHQSKQRQQCPHQSSQDFCVFGVQEGQGTYCESSSSLHSTTAQRPSVTCPLAPQSPAHELSSPSFGLPLGDREIECGQSCSLRINYLDHCLSCIRQHDEHTPLYAGDALFYLQQQADVEGQTPNGFEDDDQDKTHRHSRSGTMYVHPYTKEIRQTSVQTISQPLWYSPLGDMELYDFTVEGANHYISYNGFVNKNCFDEITSFPESQFRFLITWLRTSNKGQRCRVICTGNPPVDSQGEWVIRYWAPWLDKDHPNPAAPGELRWFAVIDGKDVEVENGEPFRHEGKSIRPQSRTFIPSRVQDNPFLMETGYEATLQALPEPLRSRMLEGDFTAGKDENPFQVIPSAWVTAAQARWSEQGRQGPMDSVGQDVARGGRAETVIARRHGAWYDKLLCYPGVATPDGPSAAAVAMSAVRDGAPIHVDVIGCGTSPYDHLNQAGVHVVAVNGAGASYGADKSGKLRFYNLRAELWWKMRESLDPAAVPPLALPPGQDIRADLCAPTWSLRSGKILIESKEDLMARIGRSPDKGDAIVYAGVETPKRAAFSGRFGHVVEYDPLK